MGQAESNIKIGAGSKQTVLCPNGSLVFFHQLTGSHGNVSTAGHHPGADADTLREDDRAFSSALPQSTGKITVSQRQNVGQGNYVGSMAVVDHAVGTVGGGLAHAVVHKVAGKLGSRLCAIGQAPDNAPAIALIIDLNNADAVDRVWLHIAEELAGTGGDEIFPGQVISLNAHVDPLARGFVKERTACGNIFLGHAVGQVAAVALMPALQPAVVAHTDKTFYVCYIINRAHNTAPLLHCLLS